MTGNMKNDKESSYRATKFIQSVTFQSPWHIDPDHFVQRQWATLHCPPKKRRTTFVPRLHEPTYTMPKLNRNMDDDILDKYRQLYRQWRLGSRKPVENAPEESPDLTEFNHYRTRLHQLIGPLISESQYEIVEQLPSENCVSRGICRETNVQVALKSIPRWDTKTPSALTARKLKRAVHELETVTQLTHPNIVEYFDSFLLKDSIVIVTRFIHGGDLLDNIAQHGVLTERHAAEMFQKIVRAVCHCHRRGICHRDLKPENVLISSDRNVFLTDFGTATKTNGLLHEACGTPMYAAPEVISIAKGGYDGFQVDAWGLGILLYCMVVGSAPFNASTMSGLRRQIDQCHYTLPSHLSSTCRQLIQGMLCRDPTTRLTAPAILNHPWCCSVRSPPLGSSVPSWREIPSLEKEMTNSLEKKVSDVSQYVRNASLVDQASSSEEEEEEEEGYMWYGGYNN